MYFLENDVKVYIKSINIYDDENIYKKHYDMVSELRKQKIDGYRFDKDKKLSLLSEVLLKEGLDDIGINYEDIDIEYGTAGKPYLKNNNEIYYNISHSGEYAMLVLSDKEIGCDIEKIADVDINLAKRFFHKNEYENIISKNIKNEQLDIFYKYWVLKESFIKCTGLGMKIPFDSFEIYFENEDINVRQNINDKKYAFFEKGDMGGYKFAICKVS